jgi:predicted nucleotidyltransferase
MNSTDKPNPLSREELLQTLRRCKPELVRRFGVRTLALFGSSARDQLRPDSDIDVLVSFDGAATSRRYFGVQFYLEDQLNRPVDLVTDKALRAELRPYIEREAVHV